MVHRQADSRLLVNLLSHETQYSKALHSLLDGSRASLSSFSAYASASPPPLSQTIIAILGLFAAADEAMRKYTAAMDEWCEQLKTLKDMEDEVANIMRDREILVNRLIKTSKKSNRESVDSFSPSNSSTSLKVVTNSKLNQAQVQLQACEAHLSIKEGELNQTRTTFILRGLKGRCKALLECAREWADLGRDGLAVVDGVVASSGLLSNPDSPSENHLHVPASAYAHRQRPSFDTTSSLGPSQSASQITLDLPEASPRSPSQRDSSAPSPPPREEKPYRLSIPPAHSISEQLVPSSIGNRISVVQEDDEGEGSSVEEEEQVENLEVRENKPFGLKPDAIAHVTPEGPRFSSLRSNKSSTGVVFPTARSAKSEIGHTTPDRSPKRDRKLSNLFGRITGFFGGHSHAGSSSSSPSKSSWSTRTDAYLRRSSRSGAHDDSSDEEVPARNNVATTPAIVPRERTRSKSLTDRKEVPAIAVNGSNVHSGGSAKLVKKQNRRASVDVAPSSKRLSTSSAIGEKSLASRPARRSTGDFGPAKSIGTPTEPVPMVPAQSTSNAHSREATQSTQSSRASNEIVVLGGGATVSRSSTVRSNASRSSTPHQTRSGTSDGATRYKKHASPPRKGLETVAEKAHSGGAKRAHTVTSFSPDASRGQQSLMSIVDSVTRQNREGWHQGKSNGLVEVKAPPPISDLSSLPSAPAAKSTPERPSPTATGSPNARRMSDPRRLSSASDSYLPLPGSFHIESERRSRPPERPLRSALRNRSPSPILATPTTPTGSTPQHRTPSPSPPQQSQSRPQLHAQLQTSHQPDSQPTPQIPQTPTPAPEPEKSTLRPNITVTKNGLVATTTANPAYRDSDLLSISSSAYETSTESGDIYEDAQEDIPPTPPPHDIPSRTPTPTARPRPLLINTGATEESTDISFSSGSSPPSRRKSVRMSLQPTFSPTPPALDDDEQDYRPWNDHGGPSTPRKEQPNGDAWVSRSSGEVSWEDSSDEDEEYKRARKLLQKAARSLEKVGKMAKQT